MGSETRAPAQLLRLGVLLGGLLITWAATYDFESGLGPDWKTNCTGKGACFKVYKVRDRIPGPSADHTLGTDQGSCAYATGPGFSILKATVQGPFCFIGWYHQSGVVQRSVAYFRSIQQNKGVMFHFPSADLGGRWRRVTYSEARKGPIEIEITSYMSDDRQEYAFAVDDLTVDWGRCKPVPRDGSCDFDWGDACGYSVGNSSEVWNLRDGTMPVAKGFQTYGPDATVGTITGGYAYYMPRQHSRASGVLTSVTLEPSPRDRCLEFYYFIPSYIGASTTNISLSVINDANMRSPIWKPPATDLFLGQWIPVKASYKPLSKHKLKFTCSIFGGSHMGFYCAVDGIRLIDCKPPEGPGKRFCDFESDWCDWRNVPYSTFPWILQGGTVESIYQRPSKDHTLGNSSGSYLFISNVGRYFHEKAQLINSVSDHDFMTRCMTFWYIAAAGKDSKLRVVAKSFGRRWSDLKETLLWEADSGAFDTWQMGSVAVSERTRVVIEGVVGSSPTQGYMVVDDISIFKNDSCETIPVGAAVSKDVNDLLDCAFVDDTLCRWSSPSRRPNDTWLFPSVTAPVSNIGPTPLSDKVKGSYIFLTRTTLSQSSNLKVLTSTIVPQQKAPVCGSFYYHMFAAQDCTLTVNVRTHGGMQRFNIYQGVFSHYGRSVADRWYRVQRTIDLNTDENQLEVKVTSDGGSAVELGIGPIQFTSGACEFASDSQGWCDFEYNTCGWKFDSPWRRQMYGFLTLESKIYKGRSGPLDSEYFMEFKSFQKSNASTVTSPEFTGSTDSQCLEFWHQRKVRSDGAIQVELLLDGKNQVLWTQPPYPQDDWMFARVPVQVEQGKNFQVVFRATAGGVREARLRVDDVALRPGPCSHVAECQFSDNFCGYVNGFVDDFRWLVGQGRRFNPTPETTIPWFSANAVHPITVAYVDLTVPATRYNYPTGLKGKDVRQLFLTSPIFEVKDANDTVIVHYVRKGEDILSMKLSQVAFEEGTGKPTTLQTNELPAGLKWKKATMVLKTSKYSQITINLTRGPGAKGIAAISRILFRSSLPDVVPTSATPSQGETSLECDFENGTSCGWETNLGSITWKLNDPPKGIPPFPRSDRTLQAYRGRFLFAQGNSNDNKVAAILRSPEIPQEWRNAFCFSIWTISTKFMFVYVTDQSGKPIWMSSLPSLQHWSQSSYFLKLPQDTSRVTLRIPPLYGLVALDDISVKPGRCPESTKCTFEAYSFCAFSQPYDNVAPWRIRLSSELNTTDHTSGTKQGRVLYLDTTNVDSHHPISRVFFRQRPPTEASCLKFWWRGYGFSSELNVYRFTHETVLRDPIVSLKTTTLPWWSARTVTVSSKSNWKVVFEVLSSPLVKAKSGVMLDDVEVTDGECPQTNVCTFEDDVCYPWVVTKRNTTTDFQGLQLQLASQFKPLPRDHTIPTGDGYYLLLRSAGSRRDKSSLMIREPGRFQCASFWYYLSGKSNGCIIQAGRKSVPETNKGWKRFQFDLSEPNGFGKGIHVFSGEDTESFAAIDDVIVDEQPCSARVRPTEQFNCGGNKFIPIERVCDFVKDCPNEADERNCGSCKFSNDTCGWNFGSGRGSSGTLIWRLRRAGEVQRTPRTDHEGYADGSYMLMHGIKNPMVDLTSVAIAYAPAVRNTGAKCQLIFWYNYATQNHIVAVDLGILKPPMFIPIWSLSAFPEKPPERTWKRAIAVLGRFAGETKLYFRGMESPVSYGYFAIDEMNFSNCGVPPKQPKCENDQFQCSNGACVLSYDVCNYVDDCGDLSDETNCGDYSMGCNFDSSFCEWRPQAGATPKGSIWKREGPYTNLNRGPTRDHTSSINEGKFLILRASQTDVDAEIAGPVFKPGKCWITFFHTILGGSDSVITLNVRTTSNGPLIPVWKYSGPGFPQFIKGFQTLDQKQPYQVVFRGTHAAATRNFGYIAIDDVSFGKDCVPHNESLPKAPSIPAITIRPPGCPAGHFKCLSSRQCIPPEQLCDFHEDCPDGSDEARCGACDFTTDMCGLTNQYPSSRFAWNWTSTSMVVSNPVRFVGMPTRDGKNNQQGSYCAFRLTNPSVLQGYLNPLVTPPLGRVASTCMVSFYAFAGHEPTHLLFFGVQWYTPTRGSNTPRRRIFAMLKGSDTKATWNKVTVKVGNWPRGARFYFLTNLIHASIDEIKYNHCHPDKDNKAWQASTLVTCNFENDTNCAWFPENTDVDLNWVRYSGGTITHTWQPSHLDLKNSGAYMYATNPSPAVQKALMVSKTLKPTNKAGRCLSFWYNMWHPNSGRLNVLVRSEDNSTELVWSRTGTQGKAWRMSRALLRSDFQHQIVLEATLIGSTPAVIAVDYITLLQGSCPTDKQKLNCDFTAGSCGWMPHNWKITEGESAVIPRTDHSTESGSGGFAMLKRTGGRLISLQLNTRTSPTKCLRFWYYLSGSESEELTVSRVVNFKDETVLWNVSAENVPQKQWLSGSTSVDVANAAVFVVFGGSTSGSEWTAVAVDDIRVNDGSCQGAGSCDFENGDLCNWRNAGNNNNSRWYVTYGSSISRFGGPKGSPKGNAKSNYLLLDSQDLSTVSKGILESELLTYSPTSCLEFYYYMAKGSTPSLLSEIIELDGSSIDNHKLFGTTYSGAWTRVVFQLNDLPLVYKLRLTGTLGVLFRRDIAVDEITLIPGKCPHGGNVTDAPTAAPVTTRAPGPTIKPVTTPNPEPLTSLSPGSRVTTRGPGPTSKPVTTPKSEPLTNPFPVSSKSSTTDAPIISTTATPVTPTPVPEPLTCQSSEFNCRDNKNCVPLVLLCDGVEDCPNGLDEKCGDRNKCAPDTVFCRSGTPSWCIPRTYLCDGNNDCSDGSDESLCASCPPNYCQNGGTCSLLEGHRSPECQCLPGTSGIRCNVRDIGAAKGLVSSSQGASAASVAVPVVLVLVILCAGVAGFVYYRRKKSLENAPVFLNNPTYDAENDEARIFT